MKKTLFYATILLFLLLIYTPNSNACVSEPPSERYYVTFFEPSLWGDTTYRTCYLDAKLLIPFEWDTPLTKKYAANLLEWQYYCKNLPAPTDIATVVYQLPVAALVKLQNGQVPDSLKNNTFVKYLRNSKDAELLAYLVLAKKCESLTYGTDYWAVGAATELNTDPDEQATLLADARNAYKSTKSDFLKLRYAYQMQKLDTQNAATLYDELIAPLVANKNADPLMLKSMVQYWALAYKAGRLLKANNAESLYLFAKCFLNDPEKRELYLSNFRIADQNAFDKALLLAHTPDEKATLWLMKSCKTKELDLDALTHLYQSNPSSPLLNLLLSREINKIERQLLSPILMRGDSTLIEKINAKQDAFFKVKYGYDRSEEYANNEAAENTDGGFLLAVRGFFGDIWRAIVGLFSSSSKAPILPATLQQLANDAHIKALTDLTKKALAEGKTADPALWQTAAAYLNYLSQNHIEASKMANTLPASATQAVRQQALLVDCLARLANNPSIDEQLENDFAMALKGKKQAQYEYDNYGVFSRSLTALAQKYVQQGNLAKAILCLDKATETTAANTLTEFSATPKDLDALLQIADKADRTPFERFLLNDSRFDRNLVLEIQGTKLLRNQQYDAALAKLNQIDAEYWTATPPPVEEENYYYNDNFDNFFFTCNFDHNQVQPDSTQNTCNKLQFAQKVVSLLHKAQSNKNEAASYYYQVANGFFNTPFWGYNARLWQGSLIYSLGTAGKYPLNSSPADTKLYEGEQQFLTQYGNRKAAIDYYKKAIDAQQNAEITAKSAYLIKFCQMNPQASFHLADTTDLTYIRLLKEKYSNTQFYADIIKQCPNLNAYLGK